MSSKYFWRGSALRQSPVWLCNMKAIRTVIWLGELKQVTSRHVTSRHVTSHQKQTKHNEWKHRCVINASTVTSTALCPVSAAPGVPAGDNGVYRFSAFWLRSSVVSVLISLISDTSPTRGPYIKLIFGTGRWNRGLLRPLHASTWSCSISRNGALLLMLSK